MLVVLPGTISEDEVAPAIAQVQETLEKHGAESVSIKDMGKSRLAYPIKHIRYGYFQLVNFSIETTKLAAAERDVRLLGNLLRTVVTVGTTAQVDSITLASDPTALSAPPKESRRDEKPRRRGKKDDASEEPAEKVEKTDVAADIAANKETEQTEKQESPKEELASAEDTAKQEISMDDIDKKLDQVLQGDMDKV